MTMEVYEFTPPNIPVVPRILSDIRMIHELKNESQWVLGGARNPDGRDNVLVIEATACQCFFVEPLSIDLW